MKRIWLSSVWGFAWLLGISAQAQPEPPAKRPALLSGMVLQTNFVERETVAFTSDFLQLVIGAERGRWFNPALGIEVDLSDSEEYRSYFFSETLRLTARQELTVRLNHIEYPLWEIGSNILNAYYHGGTRHFEGAVGVSYQAVIFDPKHFDQPFWFDSEAPELRLLYLLAFRQGFWKQRLGFRLGVADFTQFENYGYENVGAFVEPYLKITDRFKISFFYEQRYSALIYQIPYHNRTTYSLGLEVRP
ncbi:MAG: hypothetical protein A2V67_00725 [Deltaproteobacteria bacterium RBG_13_61_14]|nr:MAG: hypothetical protein A2V67_00725 [Deltaproteobacteria bacterium RBG_13_61_14]